jgi:hypothetical protein
MAPFAVKEYAKKTGIYTAFTIIIIISYLIYGSFLHIFPQTTVQKAWWGNAIVQWCHTFHTLPADFQYWWATAPRSLKQPLWIEYFKQQYKPGANTSQRTRPILYNYVSFTLLFFFKYLPNLKPCGTGFQIPHLDVPSCCSSPWTAIPWAWMTFGDPGPSPAKWVASFKHADALGWRSLQATRGRSPSTSINIHEISWDSGIPESSGTQNKAYPTKLKHFMVDCRVVVRISVKQHADGSCTMWIYYESMR